jgi:glucosamine 6-phosphate synthetase-like amidotransferase/phosphosugar isomerase protein
MNLTDIFKKIELAIQPEVVELASAKLADGTTVEAELLEAGQNIFLIGSEGEKVAVPVGEYPMEDGRILVVTEEGVIAEIKEKAEEAEEQEVTIEVEAAAAEPTLPEVMAMIQSLKEEVEMMKAEMGKKEEMAAQEAEKEEEVKEVVMAAEKPIVAAPVEVKPELKFQISAKRTATTADRVFNKLFN